MQGGDAHPVERAEHEEEADDEEDDSDSCREHPLGIHRDFHGEDSEQCGELDDRVQRHRRRVLEGIADDVADHGRIVQRASLLLQLHLHDLLRVVPASAGIRHVDRHVEPEHRDRDQVADKEDRVEAGECKRQREDDRKDVDHPVLGILRADFHNGIAVLGGCPVRVAELDVALDVIDRAVGAGGHRLAGCAGEPVDDRPAHHEPEDDPRIHDAQVGKIRPPEVVFQHEDEREDHRRRPDNRCSDQHRLGGGFERVAGSVVVLEQEFPHLKIRGEPEVALDLILDTGNLLDGGELEDGLRVVRHGAVAVDGNRHRSHPEHSEGHQTEGKDGREGHEVSERGEACQVGDQHQDGEGQALPEAGEVAGDQAGEDRQPGAAFRGRVDDLVAMRAPRACEHAGQLGDDRRGERAAADDRRQLPPEGRKLRGQHEVAHDITDCHAHQGRQPHQDRERVLEIKMAVLSEDAFRDPGVDFPREDRGRDHHDPHREDPHDERPHILGQNREKDEGDERHAGDAVGLEPVGRWADAVAGIVARAVGDHAGIPRVVLLDLEDDLHEVAADVGDLGEDPAADPQHARAEGFADREADEAGSGEGRGNKQKDGDHEQQLGADQEHSDAHARAGRNFRDRQGPPAQRGERHAAVRDVVDQHSEPGDGKRPADADERPEDDQRHRGRRHMLQESEVIDHRRPDENFQNEEEAALLQKVGLAGPVDQGGNIRHTLVRGQLPEAPAFHPPEYHPQQGHAEPDPKDHLARKRETGKLENRRPVGWQGEIGFARPEQCRTEKHREWNKAR